MVSKWYDNKEIDEQTIISTRIRLARNLKEYPFPAKMTDRQKEEVITKVRKAAINLETEFDYIDYLKEGYYGLALSNNISYTLG